MLKATILVLCVFVISCSQDEIDSHIPRPDTNSQNRETSNTSNINNDIQNHSDSDASQEPETVAFEDEAFYRFRESWVLDGADKIIIDACSFARAGHIVLIEFGPEDMEIVESCEEHAPPLPLGAHLSMRGKVLKSIYGSLKEQEELDLVIETYPFYPQPRPGDVMLAGITDIGYDQPVMHVNVGAGTKPEFSQNNEANETIVLDLSNNLDELRSDIVKAKMDSGNVCEAKFRDEYFQTDGFLSRYFLDEDCLDRDRQPPPQGANRGPGG